jgi:adenylosuccinate lyase
MTKEFRPARESDAAELHELIVKAYQQDLDVGVTFEASHTTQADILRHIQTHICHVLTVDGKLAATCSLRLPWSPKPGPTALPHIKWLAVHPDFERQGLGREMLSYMERKVVAKTLKCPALTLGTAVEHPWLSKMYESLGYVHYETVDLGFDHLTAYFRKELV